MPNITLKLQRNEAVDLHQLIALMPGEAIFKAARQSVQKAIVKAWPEAETGEKTEPGEARTIDLDPRQQRALAEGFLALANNPQGTGEGYDKIQKVARRCRLWGWVEKFIEQRPVPEFDGELDGEPELLDAAAVEAEGAKSE